MKPFQINFLSSVIPIILLSLLVTQQGVAQHLSHQIGLSFIQSGEVPYEYTAVYPDRQTVNVVTPHDYLNFLGIYYHPSVRFYSLPNKLMSVGAGIPLSTSFLFSTNSSTGASPKNFFLLSLPLQLELNIGAGAAQGTKKVGGFLGLGASLQMLHTRSYTYYEKPLRYKQLSSYLSAGLRFRAHDRLFQFSYAKALPFDKRENLGEIQVPNGQSEASFERSFLRITNVLTLSMFFGKKY